MGEVTKDKCHAFDNGKCYTLKITKDLSCVTKCCYHCDEKNDCSVRCKKADMAEKAEKIETESNKCIRDNKPCDHPDLLCQDCHREPDAHYLERLYHY